MEKNNVFNEKLSQKLTEMEAGMLYCLSILQSSNASECDPEEAWRYTDGAALLVSAMLVSHAEKSMFTKQALKIEKMANQLWPQVWRSYFPAGLSVALRNAADHIEKAAQDRAILEARAQKAEAELVQLKKRVAEKPAPDHGVGQKI